MIGANSRGRGPIWRDITRAQNGQAVTNLARAFHLPRPQAKIAVLSMLDAITRHFDEQTVSRGTLARLIELLGKNDYEQVLQTPALMGATATQVIGNDALTAIAGREAAARIADEAARHSGISQMIAEYLLPVVAAMFMGALSARTRTGLQAVMGIAPGDEGASEPAASPAPQFPIGRGSSGYFSSAAVATGVGSGAKRELLYQEFAQRIRGDQNARQGADPLNPTRRLIADALGVRARHAPWLARLQLQARGMLQAARHEARTLLSKWRGNQNGEG